MGMKIKDTSAVYKAMGMEKVLVVSVRFCSLLLSQHFVVEISLPWRAPSTLQVTRMITPTWRTAHGLSGSHQAMASTSTLPYWTLNLSTTTSLCGRKLANLNTHQTWYSSSCSHECDWYAGTIFYITANFLKSKMLLHLHLETTVIPQTHLHIHIYRLNTYRQAINILVPEYDCAIFQPTAILHLQSCHQISQMHFQ